MYIVHLGYSGFPGGSSTMKRILLTFKAIKSGAYTPLIINKYSYHRIENATRIARFQGVPLINTSPSGSRPDSLLWRNLNKILGFFGEFLLLIKKRKKIRTAIFYGSSILELIYYRLLSKILNFKLVIHYVEFRSEVPERKHTSKQINDRLFDKYCIRLCDGAIVISEYLKNYVLKQKNTIPILKIPAICDFDEFRKSEYGDNSQYLMYCGGIMYLSVIEFVLDLYIELQKNNLYNGNLLLAIGGGENQVSGFERLREVIHTSGFEEKIKLMRDVPHNDLISLYCNSELLIVPLRNTIQDIAGFHHKVGEYCASGKPIISTNLAEMNYYFEDDVSAILASDYSVESYTKRLAGIMTDKEKLSKIGKEGFTVGMTHLNYKNYVSILDKYLFSI